MMQLVAESISPYLCVVVQDGLHRINEEGLLLQVEPSAFAISGFSAENLVAAIQAGHQFKVLNRSF